MTSRHLPLLLLLAACAGKPAAASDDNVVTDQEMIGPIPGPGPSRAPRPNPLGNDSDEARAGRSAFVSFNCYGCHGGHGGGGMGPSLRDRDWIYGSSPEMIYDSIARGRAHGMPAWGTRLPEKTIWQLVTYIQTLSTKSEIDPPS